eukprot:5744034-Lingulodinium_polyedra.AAC.1
MLPAAGLWVAGSGCPGCPSSCSSRSRPRPPRRRRPSMSWSRQQRAQEGDKPATSPGAGSG